MKSKIPIVVTAIALAALPRRAGAENPTAVVVELRLGEAAPEADAIFAPVMDALTRRGYLVRRPLVEEIERNRARRLAMVRRPMGLGPHRRRRRHDRRRRCARFQRP